MCLWHCDVVHVMPCDLAGAEVCRACDGPLAKCLVPGSQACSWGEAVWLWQFLFRTESTSWREVLGGRGNRLRRKYGCFMLCFLLWLCVGGAALLVGLVRGTSSQAPQPNYCGSRWLLVPVVKCSCAALKASIVSVCKRKSECNKKWLVVLLQWVCTTLNSGGAGRLFMCLCIMVYRVLTQPDRRATLILPNPHLACFRAEHLQGEQWMLQAFCLHVPPC